MTKLFCPDGSSLVSPERIIPFLGKASHWRAGRSAYEAAYSWWSAQDIPREVRNILDQEPAWRGSTLVKAWFERQTALDELGRPSQTDVLAVLETSAGTVVVGIEAKVDESFGPLVSEWNDNTPGKTKRLAGLAKQVGLDVGSTAALRYQLLHRCVAAILEAKAHGASESAMIVQSFSPLTTLAGFTDFSAFSRAIGIPVMSPGQISQRLDCDGIGLRLGWAVCPIYTGPGTPA